MILGRMPRCEAGGVLELMTPPSVALGGKRATRRALAYLNNPLPVWEKA